MAWNKDVNFLVKTHTTWNTDNPVIPVGAIIGIDMGGGSYRVKMGIGDTYQNTNFINQSDIDGKLDKGTDPNLVVKDDGSREIIDTLTIQDIIDAGYHLITTTEWDSIKLVSFPAPSFIASPSFSTTTIREIGSNVTGSYIFNFTKTNNDHFKTATGGNIAVNQGNWSGLGDFDLKSNTQLTITANSFTLSQAGLITFTLFARDKYDQVKSIQTFNIEFQYPVWAGTSPSDSITDQNSLTNLVKKLGKTADGLEFYLDPGGNTHYFHILVPTIISTNLDIRDMSAPAPGSGNMVLQGTVLLSVGSLSVSYNHYVSSFQSAGEVDFLLKYIS